MATTPVFDIVVGEFDLQSQLLIQMATCHFLFTIPVISEDAEECQLLLVALHISPNSSATDWM